MKGKKDTKGVTAEKDEFSEWFTQIMLKADLADYSDVSGMMVFKPGAYEIWEKIVCETGKRFKKLGIKNAYFPLLIPEKSLAKEEKHVEGFNPEVAWVTHAGDTKLNEKLAIRPTSEAIMYESYSKWIRSWRDLPLKINQWNNVVRWEFKHPVPFLRTREFLWNEGHTAYATEEEAKAEEKEIIGIYKDICENYLALPSLVGKKTEKEKFAGAEYSVSMEFYMPNGKAVQGPPFHHDGQNFAKAYGIRFLNKNGKKDYVWQNTFAITTRMLGVMFAVHSDSKGLILPPEIAENKIVIVPIFTEEDQSEVVKKAKEIQKKLGKWNARLDDREDYRPGFKFNEWEMKGIPIRIEIGPKDLAKQSVVLVRRDNGKKENVKIAVLTGKVEKTLDVIQKDMFAKASKLLNDNIVSAKSFNELKKSVDSKKIVLTGLCRKRECEDELKHKTGGAKVLNIDSEKKADGDCVICGNKADYVGRVGKSY
ncbi:proline--tRNA ligase [Candidatus Pacearchaeota archaeon]|nr:proline--tRNA ligase [Candidatus Pacearchaeota archaeon]|tara:strand:- start:179 stop:1618 length:1440 start_codon:yes stop_codon:yes gene_type:complete